MTAASPLVLALDSGLTTRYPPRERKAAVSIDDRCTACGACIATCPEGALSPAPKRPRVDAERCTLCLACIEICPRDAIR